jgi:hypothetical protein
MAFDPDAYLAEKIAKSGPKPAAFDPDAYLEMRKAPGFKASVSKPEKSSTATSSGYGRGGRAPTAEEMARRREAFDPVSAVVEPALKIGGGLLGSALGGVAGIGTIGTNALGITNASPADEVARYQEFFDYQPRTEEGQLGADAVSAAFDPATPTSKLNVLAWPGIAGEFAGDAAAEAGWSPMASTAMRTAPDALASVLGVRGARSIKPGESPMAPVRAEPPAQAPSKAPITPEVQAAQQAMNKAAAESQQSMGAASAAIDLKSLSPRLQKAVVDTVRKTGGALNPEAMIRQVRADSLPVPGRLTQGQALKDSFLISKEKNFRGKEPAIRELLDEQNDMLVKNIQAIRDRVGPDVFTTNATQHADTFIKAYKEKAAVADANTSADYKALKDANGGQFPIDAPTLLGNATQALHQELLFDHAPKAVMSTLERLANSNNMTFENFESLRTNLARIQRSKTADGNEIASAGIIRNAMEQLPLAPSAANLKPLADKARASAKAQFDALKADPAYDAAANDLVTPDAFTRKFVTHGNRDQVALMRKNLEHDPVALQTMDVAAVDHLRDAARIDPSGNGNFASASYNKAWRDLERRLETNVLDPRTVEDLTNLGEFANDTQFQPRGSFVNTSNTMVAAAADYGAGAMEGAANVAAGGVPVGTWTRKVIDHVRSGKYAKEATEPGAGMSRLSDLLKNKVPK